MIKLAVKAVTLNALILILLELQRQAIVLGIDRGLSTFIRTVARKTGALRRSLRRGFHAQVPTNPFTRVTIKFPYSYLASFPVGDGTAYAKYHVIGWQTVRTSYKKPTTPGTRPIDPQLCLFHINAGIRFELDNIMNRVLGLDFKRFFSLIGKK